ncbi:membrane protein [Lysinibacillus sp. BF-4]|uniref:putative polysaccharide biosynthesis protein n=1 Tax=Lysinibacillus sp. BF-4 TaxID=1473546 RepID=UPI000507D10D|nr:polysaccharide biosynthesis protein [Lysinibacillus sp. BF-4]KFL42971.1 membrane protein [Lysinibacillus sp. BF-4]
MSQPFGMKTYMRGAALLTVAALLVKILSAIYRVPFQNLVGDEGFYIYQQVYPFIAVFVVWTSGGFSVAISKLLADNDTEPSLFKREQQRRFIMRVVFWYLVALAAVFFIALYFGADSLANLMGDPALSPLLRTGSFIVWIMPAFAVVKGAFQSRGYMAPIAYAQVVEQVVRVAIILVGTAIIMKTTASLYSAGRVAVLGTVIGEAVGFVLLAYWYMRQFSRTAKGKNTSVLPVLPIIKEVTWFSLSVSMSSLLLLSYQFVDSFTIYSLLVESGVDNLQAKELKGVFDRGQPLVQLGIVIASSLTLAIVPLIAHQTKIQAEGGRSALPFIQLTYRTALIFGSAAAIGLMAVMPDINVMLFKTNSESGVLAFYMLQIIPLSLVLTFTGILQGLEKLKVPALLLILGFIIKLVINQLTIVPLGIEGAALASNIGLAITAWLLVKYSKRFIPHLADSVFHRQLISALVMMLLAVFTARVVVSGWAIASDRLLAMVSALIAISVGALVFVTLIARWRLLSEKEWFLLPFGRRIATYQLWLNRKK